MDDTDATVPVPDIPAAATRDSAIDDQQCGSVTCVLQRSWEDLYKAEMPRLVRYLMKCFGDSGMRDAADAAHNAFVELFTNWDTVRSPGHGCGQWRSARCSARTPARSTRLTCCARNPPQSQPQHGWSWREETQAVLHGLRQLPLAQRQVLALIYDEFSYGEIAQIMGISQAAVRKNAERARRRMSELLGSHIQTGSLAAIWDRGSTRRVSPHTAGPMLEHRPGPDTSPSSGPS